MLVGNRPLSLKAENQSPVGDVTEAPSSYEQSKALICPIFDLKVSRSSHTFVTESVSKSGFSFSRYAR